MFEKILITPILSEQHERITLRNGRTKQIRKIILRRIPGYETIRKRQKHPVLDSSFRMLGEFANTLAIEMGTDGASRVKEVE
ncbi:MAG: hypothetical protein Q7U51_02840 [Methanoregula sp.]|nr:hypothetical protein [Methanoregula sp.]